MSRLELRLSPADARALPRHPSYRYRAHDDILFVHPAPRYLWCRLDLPASIDAPTGPRVRPLSDADRHLLPPLFAAAFADQSPLDGLGDSDRETAARTMLDATFAGNDGPPIDPACFAAFDGAGTLLGASVVTLLPPFDPADPGEFRWQTPPPPDAAVKCLGRPHLTWVFVHPAVKGHGLGSRLLQSSADALAAVGYAELFSTILLGNASGMTWHWRNGFRLLSYPGSLRGISNDT